MRMFFALLACTDVERTPIRDPKEILSSSERLERGRVVLVTLDGLRWQDVLDAGWRSRSETTPLMPQLTLLGQDGVLVGDRRVGSRLDVEAALPKSLPSYQGMMVGESTDCRSNECSPPRRQTLPERVARDLGLAREEVAVFGTWSTIANALSSGDGVTVSTGFAGGEPPPWPDARWDAETVLAALAHLSEHEPRFLWIALGDADEWAHEGDLDGYMAAARASDATLTSLVSTLAGLDLWDDTTLIVTTDHGRGPGPFWTSHSRWDTASGVWLMAHGPEVQRAGRVHGGPDRTLAGLRPSVEWLLGLEAVGQPFSWLPADG